MLYPTSRSAFFPLCEALVTACLFLSAVEIAATLLAFFQEQVFSVNDHRFCALHLCKGLRLFQGVHERECTTSRLSVIFADITDLRIGISAFTPAQRRADRESR
jgi:hypothetical protein